MKKWLTALFFLSIILNLVQLGLSFWHTPDFQYKKVVQVGEDGELSLENFENINESMLASEYHGCVVAPVRSGWMILVSHGRRSEEEVREALALAENKINNILGRTKCK